jgi:hypothetical protein
MDISEAERKVKNLQDKIYQLQRDEETWHLKDIREENELLKARMKLIRNYMERIIQRELSGKSLKVVYRCRDRGTG